MIESDDTIPEFRLPGAVPREEGFDEVTPEDTMPSVPLHLFQGYGIELEYMLVDRQTLAVLPIADQVLSAEAGGAITGDVERGAIAWSNELVLHVLELKSNGPAPALEPLAAQFQAELARIEEILEPLGGRVLGTAMHPLMDPAREMKLWPHDGGEIYRAFDAIFDCRGHGWANLQSMHINLPFEGDEEFAKLHAAIRLLLPILPALAASSPIVEGKVAPEIDHRLEVYRHNSAKVPSCAGRIIPEQSWSREDYQRDILGAIYRDLAPLDPQGILQHEFANARGAIARFERNAIEIRVLDVQEHPAADLAIAAAVCKVLEALVAERWIPLEAQQAWAVDPLAELFSAVVRDGERALIADPRYLEVFGLSAPMSAGELWAHLATTICGDPPALRPILEQGPLARRILKATGPEPDSDGILAVYRALADCARRGEPFLGLTPELT